MALSLEGTHTDRIANGLASPGSDCPNITIPQVGIVEATQNTATVSLRGVRGLTVKNTAPKLVLVVASRSVQVQQALLQAPQALEVFNTPLLAKNDNAGLSP